MTEKYITICDCGKITLDGKTIGKLENMNPEYYMNENNEIILNVVKDSCINNSWKDDDENE